jgi:hypothetical protein
MLLLALLLLLLSRFLLLHDKVADVAPLAEEALHLGRLPELRCVLFVRCNSRRGLARKLYRYRYIVMLINMLHHRMTCAELSNRTTVATLLGSTAATVAIAASPHYTTCHICRSAPPSVNELALTAERQAESLTGQQSTKSGLTLTLTLMLLLWENSRVGLRLA